MGETMQVYPQWKIVAWRYARVFIAGFLVSFPFDQMFYAEGDVIVSLLRSACVAGVVALGKALREEFSEDIPLIKKLPI